LQAQIPCVLAATVVLSVSKARNHMTVAYW